MKAEQRKTKNDELKGLRRKKYIVKKIYIKKMGRGIAEGGVKRRSGGRSEACGRWWSC